MNKLAFLLVAVVLLGFGFVGCDTDIGNGSGTGGEGDGLKSVPSKPVSYHEVGSDGLVAPGTIIFNTHYHYYDDPMLQYYEAVVYNRVMGDKDFVQFLEDGEWLQYLDNNIHNIDSPYFTLLTRDEFKAGFGASYMSLEYKVYEFLETLNNVGWRHVVDESSREDWKNYVYNYITNNGTVSVENVHGDYDYNKYAVPFSVSTAIVSSRDLKVSWQWVFARLDEDLQRWMLDPELDPAVDNETWELYLEYMYRSYYRYYGDWARFLSELESSGASGKPWLERVKSTETQGFVLHYIVLSDGTLHIEFSDTFSLVGNSIFLINQDEYPGYLEQFSARNWKDDLEYWRERDLQYGRPNYK
jgi:hypothetical protein